MSFLVLLNTITGAANVGIVHLLAFVAFSYRWGAEKRRKPSCKIM